METNKKISKFKTLPGASSAKKDDSSKEAISKLNSRNSLTMFYATVMILILSSAFALRSRSIENWQKITENNKEIVLLKIENFVTFSTAPEQVSCDSVCQSQGYPLLKNQMQPISDLFMLNSYSRTDYSSDSAAAYWVNIRYTIPILEDQISSLESAQIALALPTLRFKQAIVKVNQQKWGQFVDSERVVIKIPKQTLLSNFLEIDVLLELPKTGNVIETGVDQTPPYLATPKASRSLEKFLLLDRDTRGSVMSVMSRILIAFFALFIFVVIDSTPESFGLAMFLGFEAVAIVIGERWIDVPISKFFLHTFYQMGDIFRLFFFIQISRIFRPHAGYWLFSATLLSIPYGYFRYMESKWGLTGLDVIPRFRDMTAGTLGTVFCCMALFMIRNQKLPWRKVALVLAALCSFQQILGPITHYLPELNNSQSFRQFFISYETIYTYLGALSALTNISTLENRVLKLSKAKVHGDMIQQELTLGQTVQRSFLNLPTLPEDLEVVQCHEAAVYVSGDIFYTKYTESEQKLVLLICDVTGHGVQAALKATACYMLARNVWDERKDLYHDSTPRFSEFHKEQTSLMKQFSETPDLPTFAGIEFDAKKQLLYTYRTNFNPPIVISPALFGSWDIHVESSKGDTLSSHKLIPGSLVVIFSDGYVGGSRHLTQLVKYLRIHLAKFDGSPDALKDLIVLFDKENPERPDDDRTLLVLSWKRKEAKYVQLDQDSRSENRKSA